MKRVFRSMRDMVAKGLAKGSISTGTSPLTREEVFYNRVSNSDNQQPVYIPKSSEPKARPVPTGVKVFYSDSSDMLESKGIKLQAPETSTHLKEIKVSQPITIADMRRVYLQGGSHPKLNRTQWLRDNSINAMLLPTAANYLCPKCGLTRSCKCDKPNDVIDIGTAGIAVLKIWNNMFLEPVQKLQATKQIATSTS